MCRQSCLNVSWINLQKGWVSQLWGGWSYRDFWVWGGVGPAGLLETPLGAAVIPFMVNQREINVHCVQTSLHGNFSLCVIQKASSLSKNGRWGGISVGSLVQRSRLWEFDVVKEGELWECYRFRTRERGTVGTRDTLKTKAKLTQKPKSSLLTW